MEKAKGGKIYMKVLLIEIEDRNKIGELYSASSFVTESPDILLLGKNEVSGKFNKAFKLNEKIGGNIIQKIINLIEENNYDIIFLTSSILGSYISGSLAGKLSIPIITEVTGICYENDMLFVERPIYGGKAIIKYEITKTPCILTIRRKYFDSKIADGNAEYITLGIDYTNENNIDLLEEIEEKIEGVSLEDADIIVTGGRGIGSKEDFEILKSFAEVLKGAVGASRGAVDEGWAPPQMQIGQTGKIVSPTLYFAIGVSGASQHLAGITNAKCVVAVNQDEEANIFNRARFGIVSDYKKILPSIIKKFREEMVEK